MEEYPASKRDRRRHNMALRLRQLDGAFESERDIHYNEMLHSLQASLYALHQGTNPEFLERLADLEERRDNRLTELYLWERYQTEQAQKQYDEEQETANAEYEHTMQLVKEKLRARLETYRKRLSEDRALLDVANDHSFFLASATAVGGALGGGAAGVGGAGSSAGSRLDRGLLSASDRRSLRRRDFGDDLSGLSGNEGTAGGRSTRRARNANDSDADTGTDRRDLDSVLKDLDAPPTRHVTKSYQGVKTLRFEEGLADLAMIRDQVKRTKWR